MHLFALLLATVFSSQFVAPNTGITGVTINSGGTVTTTHLEGSLPAISITVAGTPTGALVWKLALDEAGTVGAVTITDQVEPDSTNFLFTHVHGDIALTDLLAQGIPDKFYLVVVDGAVTKAAKITVTALFTLGKQEIIEYETLEDVTFTITYATWAQGTVYYAICSTAPQKEADFATAITKTETAAAGVITAKIPKDKAAALIAGMEDGNIYVYAGLTNAANAAKNAPVPIAVKVPAFTHDKTDPILFSATKSVMNIELDEKAVSPTWTAAANFKAVISLDPTGATQKKEYTITIGTPGEAIIAVAIADWATIGLPITGGQLYIFAALATVPVTTSTTPAVFSVIPNFKVDPAEINEIDLTVATVKIIPETDGWVTTNKIKAKFSKTILEAKGTGGFGELAAGVAKTGDFYLFGALDLEEQTIAAGDKLYCYVAVDAGGDSYTYTLDPAVVEVKPTTFTVTSEVVDTATKMSGYITLSKAITASLASGATNEVDVYLTLSEDDPVPQTAAGKAALNTSAPGGMRYDFTNLPLPASDGLTSDDKIYVHVSFMKKTKTASAKLVLGHCASVAITDDDDVLRFELDRATLPLNQLQTLPNVKITQTIGKAWGGQIKAKVTLSAGGTETVPESAALDPEDDGSYLLPWNKAIKDYVAGAAVGAVITITVDSTAAGNYLGEGAEITVSSPSLVSAVSPPKRTIAQWAEGSTFEVTLADGVTWTADTSAIIISKTTGAVVAADIKKTGPEPGVDRKVNVTVSTDDVDSFGAINAAIPLYFYFSAGGAAKDTQTPFTVQVVPNPLPLAFAVAPKTIAPAATVIEGLTITPEDVTGWGNTIDYVVMDCLSEDETEDTKIFSGKADKGTGPTAGVWTAKTDVDLTGFAVTTGKTLYVYCNKEEGGDPNDTPDTITVGAAKVPSFTISPVFTTWAAELKTPAITLVPTDVDWPTSAKTNFTAKFSFGATPKTVEHAIAVSATPHVYTVPLDSSLADLEIAETDLPATVKVDVRLEDGTYMGKEVNFEIRAATKPEAAMGVSPLLSLFAALVFLFVKLF